MKLCIFFLALELLPYSIAQGQNIRGVYYGHVISPKNVLLIRGKTGQVQGELFITPLSKIQFEGTYSSPFLSGILKKNDGTELRIRGELQGNYLKLTFADSSKDNVTLLRKMSAHHNFDFDVLFSEKRNPLLIGKWEAFKVVSLEGKEIKTAVKSTTEFLSNGQYLWAITYADGAVKKAYASQDYSNQGWTWTSTENEITNTKNDGTKHTVRYILKGDTLIVGGVSQPFEFSLRKQ